MGNSLDYFQWLFRFSERLAHCCIAVCLMIFSAWLEAYEDEVIARVNQRIEDLTGLTTDTAELLQVAQTHRHVNSPN